MFHTTGRRFGALLLSFVVILSIVTGAVGPGATPASAAEPSIFIHGGGWGHGVGMSQFGAEGLARQGRTATQILQHYYTGAAVSTRTEPNWNDVRVLLAKRADTVVVRPRAQTTLTLPDGTNKTVPKDAEVRIGRVGQGAGQNQLVKINGVIQAYAHPADGRQRTVVHLGGIRAPVDGVGEYRWGRIEVSHRASADCGALQCVVARNMTMDQYLRGLAEVPSSWTPAALQAQAIAGRSYAAIRLAAPRVPGLYHLLATTQDQFYNGYAKESEPTYGVRWVSAVNATSNKVLTVGGKIVQAFYSSTTGGRTENSEYVWSNVVSYLRSVADPTDNISPRHSWSRTYTLHEIGAWFGVSNVRDIRISGNIGVSGRVDKASVQIVGNTTKTVTGNAFRQTINARVPDSRDLWSTKFRIASITGITFPDVPPGVYYSTPVQWLSAEDITNGVGQTGLFQPNAPVTRSQLVTFLWRMMGQPHGYSAHGFADVPNGIWYDRAVQWAKATGITTGVGGSNRFAPDAVVTRAEAVTFLHRVSGSKSPSGRHSFPDVRAGVFYDRAVSWASQHRITTGVSNTGLFQPLGPVSRGEMAAFLYRTASKPAAWSKPLPPTAP